MRYLAWGLLGLLVVLHQDYWQWNDSSLAFGVLPVGLAWHVGISVMAAIVWLMVVTFDWPTAVDVDDDAGAETEPCA